MAKKKYRVDRIIILILSFILICGVFGFGLYKLFGFIFNDDKTSEIKVPEVKETTEDINISLLDYNVYIDDTDELGFSFIIANIKLDASSPVSFELSKLQTSEKINLGDISEYTKKMELNGYSLSTLDIATSGIVSTENSIEAKIFIPFETDSSSLSVYNSLNASKLEFDLNKNRLMATNFKLKDNNTQIEVGSNCVNITNAYISDFMLHNDQQYEIGSSTRMYTFEITVVEALEDAKISEATFIEKGTSDSIPCKSQEYRAIDMENIVNKDLTPGTKGGLFFEVYSDDNFVHEGTLLIKFTNSDKLIEISFESE